MQIIGISEQLALKLLDWVKKLSKFIRKENRNACLI